MIDSLRRSVFIWTPISKRSCNSHPPQIEKACVNLFYGLASTNQQKVGPGEGAVVVGANNTSNCSICPKCVPELFPFGFLNALYVKETAVGHKNHTRTTFGASTPEKKIKEYEKISADIFLLWNRLPCTVQLQCLGDP